MSCGRDRDADLPGGSGLTVNGVGRLRQRPPRSPTIAGSSRKTGPSTSIRTARRILRRGLPDRGLGNRSDPRHQLPHQLHAVCGAGLHRAAVLRRRARRSIRSGQHVAVCDVGNGACRPDTTGNGQTPVLPSQVALDPTKRYYISVLPGDAANPFTAGYTAPCTAELGATSGCQPAATAWAARRFRRRCTDRAVTVLAQPSPYPPGKLSVFVFEDDFPLNGEQDGGGGVDVLSPNEPGLGGFQIHLWDAMGGNGDFTGQMTYDMFNQPLTNSLAGTIDPNNGLRRLPDHDS